MKAILLSIRPNWCKLIWSGMKTVEVRKTRPKLETPFKAYIYCTGHDGWVMKLPKAGVQKMDSRVIGEFTCDKIDKLVHVGTMMDINILTLDGWYKSSGELLRAACLTEAAAKKYLQGRNGYGWHISDLKIWDEPVRLKNFWGMKPCRHGGDCCTCLQWDNMKEECCASRYISRPPQSWCYMENGE